VHWDPEQATLAGLQLVFMPLLQAERLANLIAGLGEEASEIGFASTEATNKRNRKQRVIEEADRRIVIEKRDMDSCNDS